MEPGDQDQTHDLIPYQAVIRQTGWARRTLFNRIRRAGVTVYRDGIDHRRRLIAKEDIPKLTQIEAVERRDASAA